MPDDVPVLYGIFYSDPERAYQRVTTKEWKAMLLAERDSPIIQGRLRQVVARNLGAGVLELRLAPLEQNNV